MQLFWCKIWALVNVCFGVFVSLVLFCWSFVPTDLRRASNRLLEHSPQIVCPWWFCRVGPGVSLQETWTAEGNRGNMYSRACGCLHIQTLLQFYCVHLFPSPRLQRSRSPQSGSVLSPQRERGREREREKQKKVVEVGALGRNMLPNMNQAMSKLAHLQQHILQTAAGVERECFGNE